MTTRNPSLAARHIFDELALPELPDDEIRRRFRDWCGGHDIVLHTGSRAWVESLVGDHLQALSGKPWIEHFVVEHHGCWECAFVRSLYSGMANLMVVWRGTGHFAVAATGEFPAS
jgi:hypothetical protein